MKKSRARHIQYTVDVVNYSTVHEDCPIVEKECLQMTTVFAVTEIGLYLHTGTNDSKKTGCLIYYICSMLYYKGFEHWRCQMQSKTAQNCKSRGKNKKIVRKAI
jgi:hypothetical protein